INTLTNQGIPLTSHIIKNLAEKIKGGPLGKNWVSQFVKYYSIRLKSLYLRNIDNLRTSANVIYYFIIIILYIYYLVIKKYRIMAENIYNFNKKGFLIGYGRSLKRIMTRATLESGRISKSKQDRSREFISILAYISVIGKWILPLLIY
ncbi:uncharacterized protein K444DRAFT_546312, partial [Hyaloscypha bicolor E]